MYRRLAIPQAGAAVHGALQPLPTGLQKMHDPQTRSLLGFYVKPAEIGGQCFLSCVPGAQQRVLQHLQGASRRAQ